MIIRTQQTPIVSIVAFALASRCNAGTTSAPAAQTISIGTEQFVIDPNNVVLDGIAISAGERAITINNKPVSMDVADDLFVGTTEVLTGHIANVNETSSASNQKTTTTSVRAGTSSSSMSKASSNSTVPQANLNTAGLQGFLYFLQTPSGASGTSQARSLLNSTAQSTLRSSNIASQSELSVHGDAVTSAPSSGTSLSASMIPTFQSAPQSSSIASPSGFSDYGNVETSALSSGTSLGASMISAFQSALQPQNVTSASSMMGIGGLGGQNAGTKTGTPSSILGNSTARGLSSLAVPSSSSSSSIAALALAVNPDSGITTFAPAASSMPITSSQPNIAAASSSVLILAGALLSLSAEGKSLSDDITLSATKTSFSNAIETLESQLTNLKGLLGGLGGNPVAPPSCHASKFKARFKKRNLLGDLDKILSDCECAAQDLSTLKINLQAEPPILDDIGPALDDLGATASDMEESDEDDDDDDTSTDSPSQIRTSPGSKTMASLRSTTLNSISFTSPISSQTLASFNSNALNSKSSSSAILSQTITEYPFNSGPLYVEPASISEDPAEVSALNALLPSLLSSAFGADLSGFLTLAANATSSVNAISAFSTTSTPAGSHGIPASPTSAISTTSTPARGNEISAPPTTQITAAPNSSVQSSPSSRRTPAVSPVVTAAANIVAVLAKPPSPPVCSMVLANAGDGCVGVDYCNCSSTYVPPLTSTVDGSVTSGCSYATQPPANDCPINSIALGIANALNDLASAASAASHNPTTFTPSTTLSLNISSTMLTSSVLPTLAQGLETPEYSGLDTTTIFASPQPTTSPSVPIPSVTSHNDKGSGLCSSINDGAQTCKTAYSYFNPEYLYLDYTAYVQSDDNIAPGSATVVSPTADRGCTAMLMCAPGADGLYGKQIIAAFDVLYSYADVQVCGSISLANGCWMTTDFCSKCEASVPCAALPVEVQPEQGGNWPCYFLNGTVWHG